MPDYKVSIDQPTRPDGDPIEVMPFGLIKNGKETIDVEMTREEAEALAGGYGITVKTDKGTAVKAKAPEPEIVVEEEGGEDK